MLMPGGLRGMRLGKGLLAGEENQLLKYNCILHTSIEKLNRSNVLEDEGLKWLMI